MSNEKHPVPKTDRERRMRWVRLQRIADGEIDVPGTKYPTTPEQRAAARKRVCEVLALEAGLPPPPWVPRKEDPKAHRRARAEPIDDTPWRADRARALRAQHERLGRYGFAFARDGHVRCVKCKEVVLAVPKGRPFAMGTTGSALAAWHRSDCRG